MCGHVLEVVDLGVDFKLFRLLQNSSTMSPPVEHRSDQPTQCHISYFFATNIAQRVQEPNRELDSAFVGASKDKLDSVDCDMCVADVTSLFGPFVKFMVEEVGGISDLPPCKEIINLRMVCVCVCVCVCVWCVCVVCVWCVCMRSLVLFIIKNVSFCYPGTNAFIVLMNSARQLQAPSLPNRISEVTNQKQKLCNDVILFLEGRQLAWQ